MPKRPKRSGARKTPAPPNGERRLTPCEEARGADLFDDFRPGRRKPPWVIEMINRLYAQPSTRPDAGTPPGAGAAPPAARPDPAAGPDDDVSPCA